MASGRYFVYVLATRMNGPLYIGMTNDLSRRVGEHKAHQIKGFTQRYNVDRLVYWETYERPDDAIGREKQLKKWRRAWKIALFQETNPEWLDLSDQLFGEAG